MTIEQMMAELFIMVLEVKESTCFNVGFGSSVGNNQIKLIIEVSEGEAEHITCYPISDCLEALEEKFFMSIKKSAWRNRH